MSPRSWRVTNFAPLRAFRAPWRDLHPHGYSALHDLWQNRAPVGSGMIERAVTVVITGRMKRRGMGWRRVNATALVALRVALLNAAVPPLRSSAGGLPLGLWWNRCSRRD